MIKRKINDQAIPALGAAAVLGQRLGQFNNFPWQITSVLLAVGQRLTWVGLWHNNHCSSILFLACLGGLLLPRLLSTSFKFGIFTLKSKMSFILSLFFVKGFLQMRYHMHSNLISITSLAIVTYISDISKGSPGFLLSLFGWRAVLSCSLHPLVVESHILYILLQQ